MTNWTCYKCGSYEVFESKYVRLNRLACIIDDQEDIRVMKDPISWCVDCDDYAILVEATQPKYRSV